MPIYEYRNEQTGEVRSELMPVSTCDDDLVIDGIVWKRILSPTRTDFRFADTGGGWRGLHERVNKKY